jgi:polysaccharide export outer membrane protein
MQVDLPIMKQLCHALMILVFVGSTAMADPRPADSQPAAAQAATKLSDVPVGYKLQPGDLLQVVVWKETDLQSEVLVRPDGGISFPLAGDMQAAGLTTDELRERLQERVRKLIPEAVVTVAVKAPNGNRVFVIGKVNRPGDFPLLRPTDVMQALSLAGGATPFASTNRIRVLHRDGTHETSIRFRYGEVAKGRHLDQNVLLQSGDTVVVP